MKMYFVKKNALLFIAVISLSTGIFAFETLGCVLPPDCGPCGCNGCGNCYDCQSDGCHNNCVGFCKACEPSVGCLNRYVEGCQTCDESSQTITDLCNYDDCQSCDSNGMGSKGSCKPYCDPNKCQTCDGNGNCVVCGGDQNQACCNGTCYDGRTQGCCGSTIYDRATQQCCTDTETPYICDINKPCCNGECVEACILLGMSETETLLKLGWSNFSKGNWQDAISYFEKGLAKLPDDNKPTNALYGLARMYEKTGDKQKAEKIYRQLLSFMKEETLQIQKVKSRIIFREEREGE